MHADDATHLYVDVAERARRAGRAGAERRRAEPGALASAPSAPSSPRATLAEAEAELEKLLRSGYRTVVAFERRGEAERTRYNLEPRSTRRSSATSPRPSRASASPRRALREGFLAPELKLAVIP